ncbi:MAG: WhiB family transcriptional regulator [Acidimicrobiales bacterium]
MYAVEDIEELEPGSLGADTDASWWADARCSDGAGTMTGLFFSEELQDIARAKEICARCPVLVPCLEGAIERREPWGVWGGQLFLNGRILTSKRRRGRPPKVPRPEDQLPDVPLPEHLVGRVELRTA